jgi:hypothetical protein
MPNATVRANARPMPKPKRGSAAEPVRRQTEELNRDVALLRACQGAGPASIIERAPARRDAESDAKGHELFGRAYARWLRARAALDDPDADGSEESGEARFNAAEETARALLVTPALYDEELFQKWEVLEKFVSDDALSGPALDNRALMALGCVKADLMRLGVGRGQ